MSVVAMNGPKAGTGSMQNQWFYAQDGVQEGPVTFEEIRARASAGTLKPDDYVWSPGMNDWCHADEVRGLFERQTPPGPPPVHDRSRPSDSDILARKIASGICALSVGMFGVHKFILGMRGPGLAMLLMTVLSFGILSPVMFIIGFIEGIVYLAKSEDEFYQDYMVNKRGWF